MAIFLFVVYQKIIVSRKYAFYYDMYFLVKYLSIVLYNINIPNGVKK